MPGVWEEGRFREGVRGGGHIVGALIVARGENEFVIYMRPSWVRGRGFRLVSTWRSRAGDKSFRSLERAWLWIRSFGYLGRVTIYPVGDPDLRSFGGIARTDLGDPEGGKADPIQDE